MHAGEHIGFAHLALFLKRGDKGIESSATRDLDDCSADIAE